MSTTAAPEAPASVAPAPAPAAPSPANTMPDLSSVTAQFNAAPAETSAPAATPPAPASEAPKPAPKAEKKADAPKAKTEAAKAETPAATTAAEEASPLDQFKEHEGMSEANKANWKKLKETAKTEINNLKNELAARSKKLETYEKATPADTEKLTKLESDLKAAHDRLAVLDLQSHPDFSRQYVEPRKKALAEAATLLTDNGIEGAPKVEDLLSKPRLEFAKTVSELAAKMPAFDQGSFVASMREAYRLQGEQQGALSKANELRQQLSSKAAAEARAAFDEGRTEFTSRIPELTIPEGATEERVAYINEFNKARQEALAEAERFAFGKTTEREVAAIATRAASLNLMAHHVLPAAQRENAELRQMNQQLAAELAAIKSKKNPGAFAGAPDASPRQQPTAPGRGPTMPNFAFNAGT